jgi:hypothetical protein
MNKKFVEFDDRAISNLLEMTHICLALLQPTDIYQAPHKFANYPQDIVLA